MLDEAQAGLKIASRNIITSDMQMTIYSFDILLSQLGTSPLFHVLTLLLDLHKDFSGGREGGLVFPSAEEFPTVCCDLHKGFGVINKAEV